ncbi:MAG TPA: metallophosphoesterase [Gemmataceae bacterium]|jgi:hypothetical protein|nr:metallophosphoesterase [Gemmataceae bacterium]
MSGPKLTFSPRRAAARLALVAVVLALWTVAVCLAETPRSKPARSPTDRQDQEREPAAQAFLVTPYLQLPSQTGITVMWETNRKQAGRVRFGTTTHLDGLAEEPKPASLHQVRIQGLSADTKYYYRVESGDLVSDMGRFRTAPPRNTKRWRLAVYGDSRTNPVVHQQIAEQIARANVDLIVHTGDIVSGGKRGNSWRTEFFAPLGKLASGVPWVGAIGNHDSDRDFSSYMALPGRTRFFALDYASAHFIVLDSNPGAKKGPGSEQFRWLSADLQQKRPATWTFVVFHHPLFSAHWNRPIDPLRWDWAPTLLDPDHHVDGMLTGHDHFYARDYRLGLVADRPQLGVLCLTTAGGGAWLYRTKARDYVALEKPVHHFTLFDFDGDQVTLSAIDAHGKLIDRYLLTKKPTPPGEYCAYEVEELRQELREALKALKPVKAVARNVTSIDTVLRVPNRFRVAVAGHLHWRTAPGWNLKQSDQDFHLKPGQPLEIPLRAEVAAGRFAGSPMLTITFEPGKFRNRTIEVYPFKLGGPNQVVAAEARTAPRIDGKLEGSVWPADGGMELLGLPPMGGRSDRVQLLADKDWLYVGTRLDDPSGNVEVKPPDADAGNSRLMLFNEHVRCVVWDGKLTWTFAVSPHQSRYARHGDKDDTTTVWRAAAAHDHAAWCVEMAIPRKLFPDVAKVRINVVHRRREGKTFVDYELCPSYGLGNDPDVIPNWKPADKAERFARLRLPSSS